MAWHMEDGGVMCFTPTMEQFRDFSAFVAFMEEAGAHNCGVAKVGCGPGRSAAIDNPCYVSRHPYFMGIGPWAASIVIDILDLRIYGIV